MKNKICCIFNIGPHYRSSVYQLMDQELHCDFYFGDQMGSSLKTMDYNSLKGYKRSVRTVRIPKTGFTWQMNVWQLIFKPYKHYIITGSPGSLSNWVLALLAIPLGKKVHAWTHGMKGNRSWFGRLLEKKFYGLCSSVLLYGDFSKKIMLEEGFKERKLIPIYNSLNYEEQLIVRSKLSSSTIYKDHFENNYPVLVYIGRIQKSKKLDLLVKSLAALKNQKTLCNLVIIGQDVEGNDIPQLVKEYNVEKNVWFYGPSYDESEIGKLLYNSDVCITPGLIGLTAIHSLTYGTPVITSDNFSIHGPEFEAIEPGVTGDFFIKDNLENLCLKISLWINLNKVKREELRIKAHKVIDEKYNPQYQVKILKKLTLS